MRNWTMERSEHLEDLPYEIGECITLTLTEEGKVLLVYQCVVTGIENDSLSELWCPETKQVIGLSLARLN